MVIVMIFVDSMLVRVMVSRVFLSSPASVSVTVMGCRRSLMRVKRAAEISAGG